MVSPKVTSGKCILIMCRQMYPITEKGHSKRCHDLIHRESDKRDFLKKSHFPEAPS
jgi:hypothetical protein